MARTPATMSRVEASPVLMIEQQGGALAVDANDVGLRREAVAHVGHVADVDHGAVDGADGQIVQLSDFCRSAVGFNLVLEGADLGSVRRAG